MDEAINSIQISEAQGNFLKAFVEMMSFKSVLEIGTLHGFSTSFFARALSVTDGKVVSIEKSEENFLVAQKKLEIYKNVHLILGDAMEVLPEISEKFDLIFIDANKSKYPDYLELAIKLLNEKGSIVLDNTLFRGYVFSVEYPK